MAISDFIQTFFLAEGVKNQRAQLLMQQQNSLAQRAEVIARIGQAVATPEGRQGLEVLLAGDPQATQFLANLAPGPGVIQATEAAAGLQAMSPEQRGQTQEAGATREVTGLDPGALAGSFLNQLLLGQEPTPEAIARLGPAAQSRLAAGALPGDLTLDQILGQLPRDEQEAVVRIQRGLQLSEVEMEQVSNWAAQHGLNMMDLAQRGALGSVELMLRARDIDAQMAAAGMDGLNASTLFEQIGQSLNAINESKDDMTPAELQIRAAQYNNGVNLLTSFGLLPSDAQGRPITPLMPTDPDTLSPGLLDRMMNAIFGSDIDSEPTMFGPQTGGLPSDPSQLLSRQGGVDVQQLIDSITESIMARMEAER